MSNDWKEKYLSKLDQFDKKQKEWAKLEEFLRQTSSRLALAAEGTSKLLDERLRNLRKAIRKNESQARLVSIMDGVSTELVRLDKQKTTKPKGSTGFLSTLVDALSLSKEMDKKSKSLKKLIHAKKPPDDEILAKEFSDFFKHCVSISYKQGINQTQDDSQEEKSGFFSRIFGSNSESIDEDIREESTLTKENSSASRSNAIEKTSEQSHSIEFENKEQIEKSVTESLHNILDSFIESLDYPKEEKLQLKEKLFKIKPTKEVHVLLGDLAHIIRKNESILNNEDDIQSQAHTILICLLEAIPISKDLKKQANIIKKNLSKGLKASEIPQALDAIACLIVEMQKETTQDGIKFQQFLIKMSGRLDEMDQFLVSDLKDHKDSWEKGVALGNVVKEQVEGIGKSVSTATDIKQLEKDLQGRLDQILSHVEEHRKNENNRVKRIQQQNKQLKEKVNNLEGESGELKTIIQNSQEKAYTDPLTQLPNRLSYDQHLEELYAHWERYDENLLMMIWDIDYFKKVNDTYGHQGGDEVLKMVAKLLREHLRKPDFIARFGGEEFVSLLPNTSLGGGFKVAEKMRSAIADLEFKYKDQIIPLTISCGISLFADKDKPEDVFERADKALYQAKEQGRNRCVIAQT